MRVLAAPAHHLRHRGDHARDLARLAVRREAHVESVVAHGAREGVELHREPRAVVGAHVHRERLRDRAQARGCSAPLTQTSNGKARPGLLDLAHEEREAAVGASIMYVHARLPAASSGRPGQRRLVSTGCGIDLIAMRRLALSPAAPRCRGAGRRA
jgi:hypothetical protein